jgi:hypothetical protein
MVPKRDYLIVPPSFYDALSDELEIDGRTPLEEKEYRAQLVRELEECIEHIERNYVNVNRKTN